MAERATSWSSVLLPDDGDLRHGLNGYTNLGCRCNICREVNADYNRASRAARSVRIALDPSLRPHGVLTTYLNWGCRCAECRAVQAARCRACRESA